MPLVDGLEDPQRWVDQRSRFPVRLAVIAEDPALCDAPNCEAMNRHAGNFTEDAELLGMTGQGLEGPTRADQLADGTARLVTALLSFLLAVALMVGPIIWSLGKMNGDDVSFDGGPLRLVVQLALAAVFARVASRRSRRLPVFGTPVG